MTDHEEIVSVVLTIILLPIIPIVHIGLLRAVSSEKAWNSAFVAFLMYILAWATSMFFFDGYSIRSLVAGVCMIALFTSGYMEALSHILRGFSMQLLIDVQMNRGLTFSDVSRLTGKGKGIEWVVQNRIDIMTNLGFIKYDKDTITLRRAGIFMGKVGIIMKDLLKMGEGG